MVGGFSFCGVDINDFDLTYSPDLKDTYVFGSGKYKVHEQMFDAHNGGYFYGTTMQPKVFILRCFYQNKHINEGFLSKIISFFRRGRTGRLVFQNRDWVWYNATITNLDYANIRNYKNGFVTITMKAYYPFARHDQLYMQDDYKNYGNRFKNSALLYKNDTPDNHIIRSDTPLQEETKILLYNGGSQNAATAIEIAGDVGQGVQIINETTNQICSFKAINKKLTSDFDKYIVCDGLNGKTYITDGTVSQLSFLYHDGGFIQIAPAYPINRNIEIQYIKDSIAVYSEHQFNLTMQGKFVKLRGKWRKITQVLSDSTVYIDQQMEDSGTQRTAIALMNELIIRPKHKMSLTKLNFIYKPTFN